MTTIAQNNYTASNPYASSIGIESWNVREFEIPSAEKFKATAYKTALGNNPFLQNPITPTLKKDEAPVVETASYTTTTPKSRFDALKENVSAGVNGALTSLKDKIPAFGKTATASDFSDAATA